MGAEEYVLVAALDAARVVQVEYIWYVLGSEELGMEEYIWYVLECRGTYGVL